MPPSLQATTLSPSAFKTQANINDQCRHHCGRRSPGSLKLCFREASFHAWRAALEPPVAFGALWGNWPAPAQETDLTDQRHRIIASG